MRQLTAIEVSRAACRFYKLPMRQLTLVLTMMAAAGFYKLPMRQLTRDRRTSAKGSDL